MNATMLTIAGNLGETPELKVTTGGKPTVRMRVAVTERRRDENGEWADGQTSWHTVIAWGALAENAAANLTKGARVIVHGRLSERSFQTSEGEDRTVWELTADEIGAALRHVAETRGASEAWPAPGTAPEPKGNARPRNNNRYAGARS